MMIIGDRNVGKMCLFVSCTSSFQFEYISSITGYDCKLMFNAQEELKTLEIGFFKKDNKIFCKIRGKKPLLVEEVAICKTIEEKIARASVFTEQEQKNILKFASNKCYIPNTYCANLVIDNLTIASCLRTISERDMGDDFSYFISLDHLQANVFLLCFSVDNVTSFLNVETKWFPAVQRHAHSAKIILVGTKIDLRDDLDYADAGHLWERERGYGTFISPEQGKALAHKLSVQNGIDVQYMECSAFTQKGVKNIFDEVVKTIVFSPEFSANSLSQSLSSVYSACFPEVNPKLGCLISEKINNKKQGIPRPESLDIPAAPPHGYWKLKIMFVGGSAMETMISELLISRITALWLDRFSYATLSKQDFFCGHKPYVRHSLAEKRYEEDFSCRDKSSHSMGMLSLLRSPKRNEDDKLSWDDLLSKMVPAAMTRDLFLQIVEMGKHLKQARERINALNLTAIPTTESISCLLGVSLLRDAHTINANMDWLKYLTKDEMGDYSGMQYLIGITYSRLNNSKLPRIVDQFLRDHKINLLELKAQELGELTKRCIARISPCRFEGQHSRPLKLIFHDDPWTKPNEDYFRLRAISYLGTDVFVITFNIAWRVSFANVPFRIAMIRTVIPEAKIIVMGTQIDLRREPAARPLSKRDFSDFVTYDEGRNLAHEYGVLYCECSTLVPDSVISAIDSVICVGIEERVTEFRLHRDYYPDLARKEESIARARSMSGATIHIIRDTSKYEQNKAAHKLIEKMEAYSLSDSPNCRILKQYIDDFIAQYDNEFRYPDYADLIFNLKNFSPWLFQPPIDVQIKILSYLSPEDLNRVMQTSKHLRTVSFFVCQERFRAKERLTLDQVSLLKNAEFAKSMYGDIILHIIRNTPKYEKREAAHRLVKKLESSWLSGPSNCHTLNQLVNDFITQYDSPFWHPDYVDLVSNFKSFSSWFFQPHRFFQPLIDVDVQIKILSYLSPLDLNSAMKTSKHLRTVGFFVCQERFRSKEHLSVTQKAYMESKRVQNLVRTGVLTVGAVFFNVREITNFGLWDYLPEEMQDRLRSGFSLKEVWAKVGQKSRPL